ncbi:MAG: hypothetical protein JEZ06_06845 [Anaerolineaceae bacterium]|nr:hypothetical protein [Anaerolineaceae bacterium]
MKHLSAIKSAFFSIGFISALTLLIILLLNFNPVILRRVSISLRYNFTFLFPALILIFSTLLFLPNTWGKWIAIFLTSIIFTLSLLGVWASGLSDNYLLSGLIPLEDASDYFANAITFPFEGEFTSFASRRPIFNSFFVGLTSISQYNLVQIQSILITMAAISCAVLMTKLTDFLSPIAASLSVTMLFFYFRRFAGVLSSESLGFTLGLLGLVFLLGSIRTRNLWYYGLGIFVSTLALLTRAGAFFILPMVMLWGWFYLRSKETSIMKFILYSLVPLITAYGINKGILLFLGSEDGAAFSNYAYSLYGLAKGGVYWSIIFEDYPELLLLPESEQAHLGYQYALELIKANPLNLLRGLLHEWQVFFSESYSGIWSFLSVHPMRSSKGHLPMFIVHMGTYVLSLFAIIKYIKNRKCAYHGFAIFASIGFLFSVPLAPPSHAYGLRIFASSIWVLCLLPAMGLHDLIPEKWKMIGIRNDEEKPEMLITFFITALILLLIIIGPIISSGYNLSFPNSPNHLECEENQSLIMIPYHPLSRIIIDREDRFFLDGLPKYHYSKFIRNLHDMGNLSYFHYFEQFDVPFTVLPAVNQENRRFIFLVIHSDKIDQQTGFYYVCGQETIIGESAPNIRFFQPINWPGD